MPNTLTPTQLGTLLDRHYSDSSRIAVLAGAGVSMNPPSRLPAAWGLMKIIVEALAPDAAARQALLDACDANRSEKMSEYHFLRMERLFDLVYPEGHLPYAIMEMAKAEVCNEVHRSLAKAGAAGAILLTTNFDCLIEQACRQLGIPHRVFVTDEDIVDFPAYENKGMCLILKLHGSADAPESIQTTLQQIGKGKHDWVFENNKGKVMRQILAQRNLMVLGYSGSDDFDVTPVLTQTSSGQHLLWVEHDGQKSMTEAVLQYLPDMDGALKSSKVLSMMDQRAEDNTCKALINTPVLAAHLWPAPLGINPGIMDETGMRVAETLTRDAVKRYDNMGQRWHDAYVLFSELQNEAEALRCAKEGRSYALAVHDLYTLAEMSAQLGQFLAHKLDFEAANEYLDEAETIAEKHQISNILAIVYSVRAFSFDNLGDKQNEIKYLKKAIELDQKLGNLDWLAIDIDKLSMAISSDYPTEAYNMHQEALNIARKAGKMDTELTILNNGFLLFRGRKHPDEIFAELTHAKDLAIKMGNIRALVEIYGNYGMTHAEAAEFDAAIGFYKKAVDSALQIHFEPGAAKWSAEIADIMRRTGQYAVAVEILNSALPIMEKVQDKKEIGTIHGRLGLIYKELEDYPKAQHHLQRALEYDQAAGWSIGVVDDLGNLGLLYQHLGQRAAAMQYFEYAVQLARNTNYKAGLARNLGNFGVELSHLNRHAEALACDKEAMEINVEIGNREGEAYTRVNLAGDYFNAGQVELAISEMKQALRAAEEIGLDPLAQHIRKVLGQLGLR